MRGTVYRQCWCRDPATGRKLHTQCPDLAKKGHGKWYFRYDAPAAPGERRRQPVSTGFDTKKQAQEELSAVLARIGGGGTAADRKQKAGPWLDAYLAGKVNLKARSRETDAEAFRLYWKPALGHMRVVDIRRHHVEEVLRVMLLVNRPVPPGLPPSEAEMLRRMLAARADDERRELAPGEARHKKSTRPLTPARVERMYAPFRACCNKGIPAMFAVSPCAGAELPKVDRQRALAWTKGREAAFWKALGRRMRAAEASSARPLTTVRKQHLWGETNLRPSGVMVWPPAHAGRFLEFIMGERLLALYVLAMYCGLRRGEIAGLTWAEVDLDEGIAWVLESGTGDGPKSEAGKRAVPLPEIVIRALKAWRKAQAAEQLAAGAGWADTGLAFTRPDGRPLSGQWISVRFETLAFRAGLPPVRFHDLRHGAASLLKAAGYDTKFISAILGHTRTSFTDSAYVLLFADVAREAAEGAAAVVPFALPDEIPAQVKRAPGARTARTMPARGDGGRQGMAGDG